MKKINARELDLTKELTSEEKKAFMLYSFTHHDGGKMDEFISINTSALENKYCIARRSNPVDGSICRDCYSCRYLNMRKSLREKLAKCTIFYSQIELKPEDIPYINEVRARFESFGEIQTTIQVKNYFLICEKNPHCIFTLWTKNPYLVHTAMQKYGMEKPENLIIILSNEIVNRPPDFVTIPGNWWFIDGYFSVFTKEYAEEHNIKINCFSHCIDCLLCYTKHDKPFFINEIKK